MGHYDCTNCGAYLGLQYGDCEVCTPAEVRRRKRELTDAVEAAAALFERGVRDQRIKFIEETTRREREAYDRAYEEGRRRG